MRILKFQRGEKLRRDYNCFYQQCWQRKDNKMHSTQITSNNLDIDNRKIYYKIECSDNITYYIQLDKLSNIGLTTFEEPPYSQQLLQFSDYLINHKTNEIIKYRNSIEITVNNFLNVL